MDQQQIAENNRLIAEFMGVNPTVGVPQLSYHTSWNQLMPVVEKIKHVDIDHGGLGYQQGKVLRLYIDVKIEDVYSAVIIFINWYNSNK